MSKNLVGKHVFIAARPLGFVLSGREAALRLPAMEQRRLSEELAKLAEVCLILPDNSEEAVRDGQQLAAEVRAELARANTSTTLNETMQQLRGYSWSS